MREHALNCPVRSGLTADTCTCGALRSLPEVPPDEDIPAVPALQPRRRYTDADYEPIITGKVRLPNPVPLDPLKFLNTLSCVGHGFKPVFGRAIEDQPSNYAVWAYYFLRGDGSGIVVRYRSRGDGADVIDFALCRHEKIEGAGADHRRGWHPGHCGKCGMDMSYDSGD